jgi:hypothetical protein
MDPLVIGYLVFGLASRFFTIYANFKSKSASFSEIKFYLCGIVSYVCEIIYGLRVDEESHVYMGGFTLLQNVVILLQARYYHAPDRGGA